MPVWGCFQEEEGALGKIGLGVQQLPSGHDSESPKLGASTPQPVFQMLVTTEMASSWVSPSSDALGKKGTMYRLLDTQKDRCKEIMTILTCEKLQINKNFSP